MDMRHVDFLKPVADEDVAHLRMKERTYRGSWKKRGGVGAFMMLARKWDRLENMMEAMHYDVFAAIENERPLSGQDGSTLAEIRDLRRYLLLVEAEMTARWERNDALAETAPPARELAEDPALIPQLRDHRLLRRVQIDHRPGTPEDGGQHARQEVNSPWIVTNTVLHAPGYLPQAAIQILYKQYTQQWSHLEETISAEERFSVSRLADNMPRESTGRKFLWETLKRYQKEEKFYVLRACELPEAWRHLWPILQLECNSKEHSDLPEWQQSMYVYDEGNIKWRLRELHAAWTAE